MPDKARPLPKWNDKSIDALFGNHEDAAAARFLLRRRKNPPTMAEWVEESFRLFGKRNAQTQRRLRAVREQFVVKTVRVNGGDPVYLLTEWNPLGPNSKTSPISPRLQAEVFNLKGRFCAMCGRGPSDGVKLQIDHIVPRSWGGSNDIENLEPLCSAHNNGKRDFFQSLDPHADAIRKAIGLPTPWERIGELLKAFKAENKEVPTELLPIIGRESHAGDPARRLRDLRVDLGWDIRARKRKVGKRTKVSYELIKSQPWPPEGPYEVVKRIEAAKAKARKIKRASAK